MSLPVALGLLPLSSFFEPSSTPPAPSVTFCFRRSPHLWQYLASSGQFCPQEEQNIFKFEAGNKMASMKLWISPDLLSRDARAWNFTLFLQQLSFYLQQHFIFAATVKAITASIFIMQQVLFVSKQIYLKLQQPVNLQQLLKLQQQLLKVAAEIITNWHNFKNCSKSYQKLQQLLKLQHVPCGPPYQLVVSTSEKKILSNTNNVLWGHVK